MQPTDNTDGIVVVREHEGQPIHLAHSLYETKLAGGGSDSGVGVFKMTSRPGKLLAPLHHHEFDEILLVTKGTVISFTGPEKTEHVLNAGDMIFLPAGTPEGFKTPDDLAEPAEMYWFMLGDFTGSSERFFAAVGIPVTAHTIPPEDYVSPTLEQIDFHAPRAGFGQLDEGKI